MEYRILCDGFPIGTVSIAPLAGGGPLAIVDRVGVELAVASIVIIDHEGAAAIVTPRVVVDGRSDMARVEAFLRMIGRGGGGRSRPAA